VSGFSADWLALRGPADIRARDRALARRFAAALPPGAVVLDLGAGTGAAARALGPLAPPGTRWRCVEGDPALIAIGSNIVQTEWIERDFSDGVEDLLAPDVAAVTAFALLDLVSAAWLSDLARAAHARRLPLYAPLVVDGAVAWSPADPADGAIEAAFAAHQRSDKGFGPALGPDSAAMVAILEAAGYRVLTAASPWRLGAGDRDLLVAMVEGRRAVAGAVSGYPTEVDDWAARRLGQAREGALALRLGHRDLLALP